jgi:flagellar basal-body rod modification protein FlgD
MIPADLIKQSSAVPGDDGSTTKPQGSNKLGKDEFLKLLMAQMGNQDPTAPTDNSAFVAQLATFSTLELQQNANNSLESLLMAQASANQTSMASFVGRDVMFKSDSLQLLEGEKAAGQAKLAGPATNVTAVVTDKDGKTVRTLQLGPHDAGTVAFTWDGKDDHGKQQPAGEYKVRVTAMDQNKKSVSVEQRGTGHVTGVAYEDGVAMLKIGAMKIKVADMLEINERTNP